jgi:hypothetical protein
MLDVPAKSNGIGALGSKLHLDFAGRSRLRQDMDDDTADLIARLCTRAGMIMEDMSVLALRAGSIPESERAPALTRLELAASQIAALIAAARAMQVGFLDRNNKGPQNGR